MKNIVFDMGNVLIRWAPAHFIEREGITDPSDAALLMSAIFRSDEWPMLDGGDIDEPEMLQIAKTRLPERLHKTAERLIFSWNDPIEPISGMAELIAGLKSEGKGIYLLSNASRRQAEYWPSVPGSGYFDGCIISAAEGVKKPSPEIYRLLLGRFGLKAEETVFIDDVKANADGAEAVGIKGIVFDGDAAKLRMTLAGLDATGEQK